VCLREEDKLKTHDKVLKIIYLYLRRTVRESTCMTYRGKGKSKGFPVQAKKAYKDSRSIAPFINLGARRISVINITPRPL
jgi:hypothetical protein